MAKALLLPQEARIAVLRQQGCLASPAHLTGSSCCFRFDKNLPVKPKRLPPGFFSWWWTIFLTTEDELIEVAGMDAAMVVRMLNFCG